MSTVTRRRLMMQNRKEGVIDLSLCDVYGNPIERSTANCYVVSKPGKYKFPLVYGNSIKNGKVNFSAFTNNGGEYSHDFVDGSGHIIDAPTYILGFGNRLTVSNYDEEGLIEYDESNGFWSAEDGEEGYTYACFTIGHIPSTGANILVSVTDYKNDHIEWTWHIWLWPHDLSPVEITNSTGVKYNIMPVNLASKYDADGVHIKNWFYQWGRAVPLLCPSAWNSTTDHTPGSITKSSKTSDISLGIYNPSTFYYNSSSPYNWFGTKSYYNLWDAACTTPGSSDNDTVKTVYDPCPVGWKVPNGNTFTGFGYTPISSSNGIVKMSRYSGDTVGVGFPISGYRKETGDIYNVGVGGYVWTTGAMSSFLKQLFFMYFDSDSISSTYFGGVYGNSIRPVQDDITDVDPIIISFTINGTSYAAESGMTWLQWTQSGYNTGGYSISGGGTVCHGGSIAKALIYNGNNVMKTDVVIGGAAYTHST